MNSRQTEYAEYLKSTHWQQLRWKVMCEQKSVCQVCGARNINLHHMTYPWDFYGPEHTSEMIIILCFSCHRRAHKLLNRSILNYGDSRDTHLAAIKRDMGTERKERRRRKFMAWCNKIPSRRKKQHTVCRRPLPSPLERQQEGFRTGNFVSNPDGAMVYKPRI